MPRVAVSSSIRSQNWRRPFGSTPPVGSSRKSSSGSWSSARGQREPLPLAGRERAGRRRQQRLEGEARGQGGDALLERRLGEAVDRAEEAQVLDHREIEVERELLRHVAEPVLPLLGVLGDVEAAEAGDAAGGRRQQAGQHPDRRRLAGAVRAEEAEDAAAGDVEADRVDGGEAAEPPRHAAHRDDRPAVGRRRGLGRRGGRGRSGHAARPAASLRSTNTSSSDGGICHTAARFRPSSELGSELSSELASQPAVENARRMVSARDALSPLVPRTWSAVPNSRARVVSSGPDGREERTRFSRRSRTRNATRSRVDGSARCRSSTMTTTVRSAPAARGRPGTVRTGGPGRRGPHSGPRRRRFGAASRWSQASDPRASAGRARLDSARAAPAGRPDRCRGKVAQRFDERPVCRPQLRGEEATIITDHLRNDGGGERVDEPRLADPASPATTTAADSPAPPARRPRRACRACRPPMNALP